MFIKKVSLLKSEVTKTFEDEETVFGGKNSSDNLRMETGGEEPP